jgi:hypothetical protein
VAESTALAPTIDITTAIQAIHTPGKVVEVRIMTDSGTRSGWFDDHDKMAEALAAEDGKHRAIYYTLNSCEPKLLARAKNKILAASKTTTGQDIVQRNLILIDADPKRAKDTNSTDDEKAAALTTLKQVVSYLAAKGWPEPITADSGNGYHALYKVNLPNTIENTVAIQGFLKKMAEEFDTDAVKIDTAVHDPNRITKAYGTLTMKGENTPERPHRRSMIRHIPASFDVVGLHQIKEFASKTIVAAKDKFTESKLPPVTVAKMVTFMNYYGLDFGEAKTRPEGGIMWIVQECPFNPEHDYAVFLTPDGVPGFHCFHSSASCCDKHFSEYHKLLQEKTGKKFVFHTAADTPTSTGKLNLRKASDIVAEKIDWLWKDRIAFGKLTLFVGMPGLGKGLATMDISARVSNGIAFPDCPNPCPPMDVIIFSSEDSADDTLKPRLMAAKADCEKVSIVETITTVEGERQFSLDTDILALREALVANPNCRLVIIDPLLNHLGKLSSNKEQDVRMALTPLGNLAREFKAAIIIVSHPNKRSDVDAICRAGGAMAIVGAVRSAWFFAESKDIEGLRFMVPLKANLSEGGSALSYTTVGEPVKIKGEEVTIGRISWGEGSSITLQELSSNTDGSTKKISKAEQCLTWMLSSLENGPRPAGEMEAEGLSKFGETTIKKVKGQVKVKSYQKDKQWFWALPDHSKESVNDN